MTRNEFIAETAANLFAAVSAPEFATASASVKSASKLAAALEAANSAPWQTPAALDPLIERAHLFATYCEVSAFTSGDMKSLAKAWLADYDAAKGGA